MIIFGVERSAVTVVAGIVPLFQAYLNAGLVAEE
jgi:hypothetical protein